MVNLSNRLAYVDKFEGHLSKLSEEDAIKVHVGGIGNYELVGALERRLLQMNGLSGGKFLIDLGCGGGRLAKTLLDTPNLRYLGIDVVPKLIDYCRKTFVRPGWEFEVTNDFALPKPDGTADFITAFSLFTHLLHEQTFAYIRDAYRVLAPGGMLICSFLEYTNSQHQKLFLSAEKSKSTDRPLIVFNDRDGLAFFGREVGFSQIRFVGGSEPYVQFNSAERMADNHVLEGAKAFGQSLCFMSKGTS